MPLYEFECPSCKKVTEAILPITSDTKKFNCEFCGELANKIISRSTFHLVGLGWANDGYMGKFDRFDDAMKCEF